MSDSMTTSLSAFVDGETSTDESSRVLQELVDDEDMQREWKNYHSIAAVLRKQDVSNLQSPNDWNTLAATLPGNNDILPFRSGNRLKSMLVHGGIGAGLAACVMVAVFFMLSHNPAELDPLVALNTNSEGTSDSVLSIEDLPSPQLSFDESFDLNASNVPSDIREELRQLTLEALHAYDVIRSGLEGSPMPAASVVSRNVSKEL